AMFAMATLSILPSVLIFIFFQKYLVEGISTSGLKG
ncbi:MAG: carbohydrate ABC transporter permease, partial [Lachnospiraceae bacterium]|nr:carbohydrate ABC transporter permease [Lachnospiraceae bacterium]